MTKEDYKKNLSRTLINRFREEYYEKIGVYPDVKPPVWDKIPLNELRRICDKVLPNEYTVVGFKGYYSSNGPVPINIIRETGFTTILARTRKLPIVRLRKIFIHFALEMGYSSVVIGKYLGLDHATVLYCNKECQKHLQAHPDFIELYTQVNDLLYDTPAIRSAAAKEGDSEPIHVSLVPISVDSAAA
jgi:hypothetical protein